MELTLSELEQAINYWRNRRPSTGEESALSVEVNALATTYALMIFHKHSQIPINELPGKVQELLLDWKRALNPANFSSGVT